MPWTTNVPSDIRESWIHAEFVRYLRICSDEKYYIICSNRLVDALVWLQYPQRVIRDKLIPWSERHKFLGVGARKCENTRLIEPNRNGASLSACRLKTVWWILMVSEEGGGSLFIRPHMFYMQNTMGACRCRGRALVMC